MEKIWLSRIEKLERRLFRAVDGERRTRDQAALLCEEKDRRIGVLERQLDALEANEFQLTKAVHALQRMGRVFGGRHCLNAEEPRRGDGDAGFGSNEELDQNCAIRTCELYIQLVFTYQLCDV